MASDTHGPDSDVPETSIQLSIVIPAYNAVGHIEGLLHHLCLLLEVPTNRWEIILADDASPDGTALKIGQRFPDVRIAYSAINQGFGPNVMHGAAEARGTFLAILNTDVEVVGNPFPALINALEHNETLFAVMPLIFNTALGKVESLSRLYCRRGLCWHTDLRDEEHWTRALSDVFASSQQTVARLATLSGGSAPIPSTLCGAAFVCRRDRFMELGGFDRRYRPFYWEDVDLGFRAARQGLHCATVPQALVLHRHSETISKHHGRLKNRYLMLNQLRFIQAHGDILHDRQSLGLLPKNLRPAGHETLRHERMWWAMRWLRGVLRGDKTLTAAYSQAVRGQLV